MFRLVYGSSCRSTHHKFAMDALTRLSSADAESWRRVFLHYYKDYLRGAKDPDDRFRDFKNHVLHVREENWGGAIEACVKWYRIALQALQEQDWSHAVYACGVLSHYVTDPVMPFHTGQNDQENNIHRACEWSISCSYSEILSLLQMRKGYPSIAMPSGEDWLSQAIIQGAQFGHQFYEDLVERYNFEQGVKRPPAGLDSHCRDIMAKLFGFSIQHWANILSQLLTDSRVSAPEVHLGFPALVACLESPLRFVTDHIAAAQERELIERIYEEYKTTGKVEKTQPLDDRTIDRLYRQEVLSGEWAETCRLRKLAGAPRVRNPLPAPAPRPPKPEPKPMTVKAESVEETTSEQPMSIRRTRQKSAEFLGAIARKVRAGGRRNSLRRESEVQSEDIKPTRKVAKSSEAVSSKDRLKTRSSETPSVTLPSVETPSIKTPSDKTQSGKTQPHKATVFNPPADLPEPTERSGRTHRIDSAQTIGRSKRDESGEPPATLKLTEFESEPLSNQQTTQYQQTQRQTTPGQSAKLAPGADSATTGDASRPSAPQASSGHSQFYLEPSDHVQQAPAVGGKTARRLQAAGIQTVEDLLNADPYELAEAIPAQYIDAEQITDWQDQARLACRIPELRGHEAQLLVACDYRSPGQIAACDAEELLYEIDGFARTGQGQAMLRSSPPPELADVRRWIENAASSRSLRAA